MTEKPRLRVDANTVDTTWPHGISLLIALIFLTIGLVPTAYGSVNVIALAIDPITPETLYAATDGGLWKSTDGGTTWNLTSLTAVTFSVAIHPAVPSTLYARTDTALVKSTDGGVSWQSAGLNSANISTVVISGLLPSTIYVGGDDGLFRSGDGGETWQLVMGSPVRSVAIDPVSPGTVYAGMAFAAIFKSTDGGATWTLSFRPDLNPDALGYGEPPMLALAIDEVIPSIVYAGNGTAPACCPDGTAGFEDAQGGAVFTSKDAGATWQNVIGTSWFSELHALIVDPRTAGLVYALRDRTLLKTSDAGDVWQVVSVTATSNDRVDAVAVVSSGANGTTVYAATDLGLFKSTDGGATWSALGMLQATPPPDAAPPDTSILSAIDHSGAVVPDGAATLSTSLTLTFSGTDNVGLARFECRLDGAGFSACTSPLTYSGVLTGRHTFEVRAIDTSSNVDATPARYTWAVDAAPETAVTAAVDGRGKTVANGGITPSDTITFRFAGTDNEMVGGFECRVDAGNFTACTSPMTYAKVTRGTHTFQVRAIDNKGFKDPTPALFKWTR